MDRGLSSLGAPTVARASTHKRQSAEHTVAADWLLSNAIGGEGSGPRRRSHDGARSAQTAASVSDDIGYQMLDAEDSEMAREQERQVCARLAAANPTALAVETDCLHKAYPAAPIGVAIRPALPPSGDGTCRCNR